MELRQLSPEQLRRVYAVHLRQVFPPAELKPLFAMRKLQRQGVYDTLVLTENGEELGYALLWRHRDGRFILLDYLCVPAGRRNGGIGSRILQEMIAYYPQDTVLIGEAEAPTGDRKRDEWILRRLDFYQRNGAAILKYDTKLFGVHYKTICWSKGNLPEEEIVIRKHREIYGQQFRERQFRRWIQIPWDLGEGVGSDTEGGMERC